MYFHNWLYEYRKLLILTFEMMEISRTFHKSIEKISRRKLTMRTNHIKIQPTQYSYSAFDLQFIYFATCIEKCDHAWHYERRKNDHQTSKIKLKVAGQILAKKNIEWLQGEKIVSFHRFRDIKVRKCMMVIHKENYKDFYCHCKWQWCELIRIL